MFSRLTRAALPALLIAAVAIAVTLVVSPQARAAVEALLSFNGVNVSVGDDGKLVVTGNTDAVVQQDDYSVSIQSDDGCQMVGMAIAQLTTSTGVPSAELATRYPDLVLPHVPAGYTLAPQAEAISDGNLVVTWTDAAGQSITYTRGVVQSHSVSSEAVAATPCAPTEGGGPVDGAAVGPLGSDVSDPSYSLQSESDAPGGAQFEVGQASGGASGGQGPAGAVWEAGGYIHLLAATDPALTSADLEAMRP